MTQRDPRVDPFPGDEVASLGTLKAKVVSITIEEAGTTVVRYVIGWTGEEYYETIVSATLERWRYFVKDATEVIRIVEKGR